MMGKLSRGDSPRDCVHLICYRPALYCNVPCTYPSLYFKDGGSRHCRLEIVGEIATRGRKHVLVFVLNPKRLHLPLHRCLLRNEGSERKTWGAISHSFIRVFSLRKSTHRSLSLSALSLTLVVMCNCICGNLSKRVPWFAYVLRDTITWCARGNCP